MRKRKTPVGVHCKVQDAYFPNQITLEEYLKENSQAASDGEDSKRVRKQYPLKQDDKVNKEDHSNVQAPPPPKAKPNSLKGKKLRAAAVAIADNTDRRAPQENNSQKVCYVTSGFFQNRLRISANEALILMERMKNDGILIVDKKGRLCIKKDGEKAGNKNEVPKGYDI